MKIKIAEFGQERTNLKGLYEEGNCCTRNDFLHSNRLGRGMGYGGAFENDDALDWLSACVQAPKNSAVSDALKAVFNSEFVEGDIGAAAIAAAAAVAAQIGRAAPNLPSDLQLCLENQLKGANLATSAAKPVERVRNPKTSELAAEWAQNSLKTWQASLDDLAKRLAH